MTKQKVPQANPRLSSAPSPKTQKTPQNPVASPQVQSVAIAAADQHRFSDLARKLLTYRRKEGAADPQALKQMTQEIQQEAEKCTSSEPEKLLGILGLCAIHGHDVHFLNAELEIDEHIPEGRPLEGRLQEARQLLIQRNDYLVAILVFEKSFQYLNKNGEIVDG